MTQYTIKATSQFKKDYKKAGSRHLNIQLLKDVVAQLADGIPLSVDKRDHAITDSWSGCRECHIQQDWLLVYRKEEDVLVLVLTRTGTHSDLFGM